MLSIFGKEYSGGDSNKHLLITQIIVLIILISVIVLYAITLTTKSIGYTSLNIPPEISAPGQKAPCIAQTNDLETNIGNFQNENDLTLESCYNLTGQHNKRILDSFCSNSAVLQDIQIKWNGSTINEMQLDCPSIGLEDNTPITLSGELTITIEEEIEKEEEGRQNYAFTVNDLATNELIQLKVKDKSKQETFLEKFSTGDNVKVRGIAKKKVNSRKAKGLSDFELEIEGFGSESIQPSNGAFFASFPAQDERSIVVILGSFTDKNQTLSKSYLSNIMFADTNSVDDLYRRSSFGKIGFKKDTSGDGIADIFGPFKVNYSSTDTCNYNGWASDAEAQLQQQGVDLGAYRHRLFVFPYSSGCGWSGMANVGCSTFCRAWVLSTGSKGQVIAHELGHNVGFHHAHTDLGNDGTLDSEYGDTSDPMGSGTDRLRQFNGAHESKYSWIPSGKLLTITSPGTYTISATELDPATSPYPNVARFPKSNGNYIYISYRGSIGYDWNLFTAYRNKLNIHWVKSDLSKTYFIKALSSGQSFTDIGTSTLVTLLSTTPESATFTTAISGECFKYKPTVTATPSIKYSQSGALQSYTVSVINKDSIACPSTTFNMSSSTPATGWTWSFGNSSLTIAPGASSSTSYLLQTSSGTIDGSYNAVVIAGDPADPTHQSTFTAKAVIDNTAPGPPANLAASISKTKVNLSWNISTDNNPGTITYSVYRNGIFVANTTNYTYTDSPDLSIVNSYYATAKDVAGNISASSNTSQVLAQSGGGLITTQCSDAKDNDADGFCDYTGCYMGKGKKNKVLVAPDPQCTGAGDNSESS